MSEPLPEQPAKKPIGPGGNLLLASGGCGCALLVIPFLIWMLTGDISH